MNNNRSWPSNNRNSQRGNRHGRPGGRNRHGGQGGNFQGNSGRPGGFNRPQGNRPSDQEPSEAERSFFSKTSIDPQPRIPLERGLSELTTRAIDLLCPIGRGQRGLIVSPPKAGKTTILKHLTQAIMASDPELKVYVLLVDERPEEVTDFQRSVKAEVHYSSSDQPYENHIRVARQLMKKALEQADAGQHVMVLVDSLTRLSRVHNSAVQGHGRTLSGGVDAQGLYIPRRIFGSARNIEGGGSLGILATILVQTGSRMDDVIFQEFKGTGNMELVLAREVAERRIFPAINIRESGTRKEELLYTPEELKVSRTLRSALAGMGDVEAAQALSDLLKKHPTNKHIIAALGIA